MYYKKTLYCLIIVSINIILLFAILLYLRDPYNLFCNNFINNKIYDDFRISNYNLIRDGNFDNIIMGSSILRNTLPLEAQKKLGGKWANLSFSAASYYEKFIVINYAQKHINLKNVITSLDHHFRPNDFDKNFYPKLYKDNILTKLSIYLTDRALTCVFHPLKCKYIEIDMDNIETPIPWKNYEYRLSHLFGGFSNWLKFYDDESTIQDAIQTLLSTSTCDVNSNDFIKVVDEEIIPLFKNRNTQFHLIIPPYSALYWAHQLENIDCKMKPYKYLIERSSVYDNVHIYWFYDEDFVFDIANYRDLGHYHTKINSLELEYIKQGSHIIDSKNYEYKIQQFKRRLQNFNIQEYLDQIYKFKNENK